MAAAPISPPDDKGRLLSPTDKLIGRSHNLSTTARTWPHLISVMLAAALISIAALIYFYANSMTNVYGDGVAHLNIARKIVDSPDRSFWQRYIQIGSPWLPLQTVLMLPLVANNWLWRTGLAGSIISMVCFVIAAGAIYSIARTIYDRPEAYKHHQTLPVLAAAVFVLNPSAIYIQSTPMTEMVFMAALSLAVLLFQRWVCQQTVPRLLMAAAAMSLATLSRYEAWPVAAGAILLVPFLSDGRLFERFKHTTIFALISSIGPIYWLWHNWAIYDNALEFLNGPNSARGLFLSNIPNLGWSKIFVGHLWLDGLLMLTTVAVCVGALLTLAAVAGLAGIFTTRRRLGPVFAPVVLLAIPVAFDLLSLYRGEIQIFPFSAFGLLNVRYGLSVLPLVAVAMPGLVVMFGRRAGRAPLIAVFLLVLCQYGWLVSDGFSELAIYQEGLRNGVNSQPARELARASAYLLQHPPGNMVLMQAGSLGPLVSKGGLLFSNVIHEGTARWHAIGDTVPNDVSTIIVQTGDLLDRRVSASGSLSADIDSNFEEVYRSGVIRILRRR
ncbi:MAG TPA: hypothetical protein VI756_19655 [Blastocatellia bacterium]